MDQIVVLHKTEKRKKKRGGKSAFPLARIKDVRDEKWWSLHRF